MTIKSTIISNVCVKTAESFVSVQTILYEIGKVSINSKALVILDLKYLPITDERF